MKTGVSESGATCELSGRIGIHMRMDGQVWAIGGQCGCASFNLCERIL